MNPIPWMLGLLGDAVKFVLKFILFVVLIVLLGMGIGKYFKHEVQEAGREIKGWFTEAFIPKGPGEFFRKAGSDPPVIYRVNPDVESNDTKALPSLGYLPPPYQGYDPPLRL